MGPGAPLKIPVEGVGLVCADACIVRVGKARIANAIIEIRIPISQLLDPQR
jgi:hypothetical protein